MPLSIATQHTASEVVAIDENDIRVVGHNYDTKLFVKSSLFGMLSKLKRALSVKMLKQIPLMWTIPRDLIRRNHT